MTPQQLKSSILQLAIQGKLVPQIPAEGTGEQLYKQIQKEKQALIKDGKIKKEKPLPDISEDEVPFDIPDSWRWCRWGDLSESIQYGYNAPAKETGRIQMLRISDIQNGAVDWESVPFCDIPDNEIDTYLLKSKDILFARTGGTVGKSYLVENVPIDAIYAGYLIRTRYSDSLSPKFMKFFMESQLYWEQLRNGTIATAQPNCNGKTLAKMLIPLPPLAEQRRIVSKIEELMPLVERYDKAWTRLESLNKKFPQDLKKSILQLAIQGKLVPQIPAEGTGDALYKQIQKEKHALINAGKIKKEKPLPDISEDEMPFDIPDSWRWCRIGDIFTLQAGKNITSEYIHNSYSEDNQYLCYGGNGIRGYVSTYNRDGSYSIIGRQGALCGNINYANGKFYATEHAVVVERYADVDVNWSGAFLKALNLNQYATATAQPGLAVTNINQVLIPLPPLAEQRRIVSKIEELLPLCDKLLKPVGLQI
ncbi:MAG: restriction endonuclease subunit S [Proteobacteria bacterium]|nr:restriction endonuclease subunit S [Pseudomonadota bacterium]